ncbi:MAG: DUF3313 family protein [Spongiibacteraceae bacterium]
MRLFFSLLACAALVFSGCSLQPRLQSGPDASVSYDGLTRVDHTAMDEVWIKAETDFSSYDKVMLQTAEISYKPVKGNASSVAGYRYGQSEFPLDDKQKQRLVSIMTEAFTGELKKSNYLTLASVPGPSVLLVKGKLQDVISKVPPEPMGRSDVFVSEIGSATLVLEVYDSQSGTILARSIDKRTAEGFYDLTRVTSINTWMEVKQEAKRWARLLRQGLDSVIASGDNSD